MIRRLIDCDYATYLQRQAEKARLPSTLEKLAPRRAERVKWFRDRFVGIPSRDTNRALCLGARYGEEVEALRSLGWDAKGIDVDHCPPFVEAGDINHASGNYSLIFTNAFDHCWEPMQFLINIRRRLTPGGIFVLHFADGAAGNYETLEWDSPQDVADVVDAARLLVLKEVTFPEFYGLKHEIYAVPRR